jgi:hypothetical protein
LLARLIDDDVLVPDLGKHRAGCGGDHTEPFEDEKVAKQSAADNKTQNPDDGSSRASEYLMIPQAKQVGE